MVLLVAVSPILTSCGQADPKPQRPLPTIAVAHMEARSSLGGARLADVAADCLQDLLLKSGRFTVVERRNLGRVLEEQAKESMSKVGKLVGADLVAFGAVAEAALRNAPEPGGPMRIAVVAVQARVVQVETGTLLYSSEKRGSAAGSPSAGASDAETAAYDEALLNRAVRAAVEKLVGEIALRAP